MSGWSTRNKVAALCTAFLASSCGSYIGPNLMVPLSGQKALVGASGGYVLSPEGSRGLIFGGGASIAPPGEGDDRKARGWGGLNIGYGREPVPDQSHFGVEVKAGPAAGILPDGGGYPFSIGLTYEASLLYRLSPTKRPWELGDHALTYSLLIPLFQVVQLIPLGADYEHKVATTFLFVLAYRLDSWLAVEP